jgi:hypothetical protein
LEFLTPFSQIDQTLLAKIRQFVPPEVYFSSDSEQNSLPDERDAYSLGVLVRSVIEPFLNGRRSQQSPTPRTSDLKDETLASVFPWSDIKSIADAMCSPNAPSRPSVSDMLESAFFNQNPLIFISETFLREMRGLTNDEKIAGFSKLADTMRNLPTGTVIAYLLPKILSKDLFSEPGVEAFYQELFMNKSKDDEVLDLQRGNEMTKKSNRLLPQDTYLQYVIPFMIKVSVNLKNLVYNEANTSYKKMLKLRQFDVRIVMLSLFESYASELINNDSEYFMSTILPEV